MMAEDVFSLAGVGRFLVQFLHRRHPSGILGHLDTDPVQGILYRPLTADQIQQCFAVRLFGSQTGDIKLPIRLRIFTLQVCEHPVKLDELGSARAGNMVMLGALLEIANVLPQASIDAALRRMVKSPKWLALDERAIELGRQLYKESCMEV